MCAEDETEVVEEVVVCSSDEAEVLGEVFTSDGSPGQEAHDSEPAA